MKKILINIKIIFITLVLCLIGFHHLVVHFSNPDLFPLVHPLKTVAFIYYGCVIGDWSIVVPFGIVVLIVSTIAACLIRLINR